MMETLNPIKTESLKHSPPTKKIDNVSATECSNCATTTTPLWRRGHNGETICNACGLYLKARNTLRPLTLKRMTQRRSASETKNDCGGGGTCPGGGRCDGTGGSSSCAGCPAYNQQQVNRQTLICVNCRTTTTPLWRRDEHENTICNACGLYYKLHNVHRPVSMRRSVIKRRKRIILTQDSDAEMEDDEIHKKSPDTSPILGHHDNIHSKRARNDTSSQTVVPEIEDYVTPLKHTASLSSSSNHPTYNISPHTPPLNAPLIVSNIDKYYHSNKPEHRHEKEDILHPLFSKPQYQHSHTSYNNNHYKHDLSLLPPISSERQSAYKLESLFHRRESNSSSSTSISTTLPPLSQLHHPKDSLSPPIQTHHTSPSMSPPTYNHYELSDFDAALDRLEHLRRQVRPEQTYSLSQLSQSLSDLASKAEAILSLDSLAYGR